MFLDFYLVTVKEIYPSYFCPGPISVICQLLGCAVHWTKKKNIFECPCYGSKYYKNGVNFAGSAPRPLYHFQVSLADDDKLVVNTE